MVLVSIGLPWYVRQYANEALQIVIARHHGRHDQCDHGGLDSISLNYGGV